MQSSQLQFDKEMFDLLERMVKERIEYLYEQRTTMLPSYTEKRDALQRLQQEFTELKEEMVKIDAEISVQQRIMDSIESKSSDKQQNIEMNQQKPVSKKTQDSNQPAPGNKINWIAHSAAVLKEKNMFMTDKELLDALVNSSTFNDAEKSKKYDQPSNVRIVFSNIVVNHAKKVGDGTYKKYNPTVIYCNGKIGLLEWTENGKPKAEYDWTMPGYFKPVPLEPIEKVGWEKPKARQHRPVDKKPVYTSANRR